MSPINFKPLTSDQSTYFDQPSSPPSSQPDDDVLKSEPMQTVGSILKNKRLDLNQDLHDISKILRISYKYLHAIENEDFKIFPSGPYAIGFVRSYCEHLDLDPVQMVKQFKKEFHHLNTKSDLIFPNAKKESFIPSTNILLMSFVCAVTFYSIWYYVNMDRTPSPSLVASPNQMQDTKIKNPSVLSKKNISPQVDLKNIKEVENIKPTSPKTSKPITTVLKDPPQIVIRAKEKSWLEITNPKTQKILISKVLMPGDTYDVPSSSGLLLETGNAGALEIIVDGKKIPSIGTFGQIIENYPLHKDTLLGNTLSEN